MTRLEKQLNKFKSYRDIVLRGIAKNPKSGEAGLNAMTVLEERGLALDEVTTKDYSKLDEGQLQNILNMEHARPETKERAEQELQSRLHKS
tara:strand:+ start:19176 stop:19448 length:273 start_codon:yes stop_codon:yes gene_type:complete